MGKKELTLRSNWQTDSGKNASVAEKTVTEILRKILDPNIYEVEREPNDFNDEYSNLNLPRNIQDKIFNVDMSNKHWGWKPDNSIKNLKTNKKVFIEIKRQDGWVENTEPSAGRGNAHERAFKHFSPGILRKERQISNIDNPDFLPFIFIYIGNITRDPKRNREIYYCFGDYNNNYFMWRENKNGVLDPNDLKKYLEEYVLPNLD